MKAYSVFLIAGLLLGMWVCERNSRSPAVARKAFLFGVWGGLVGAAAWSGLERGEWTSLAGLSSWGFLLGAATATSLFVHIHHGGWETGDFLNAAAPAAAAGLSVVRLGCFQAGCCFGKPADLPWAVQYGPGTPAFASHAALGWIPPDGSHSLPIHPAQLYEAAAMAFAFLALQHWSRLDSGVDPRKPKLPSPQLMFGFGAYYCGFRFLNEFARHSFGSGTGLTLSQMFALGGLIFSLLLLRRERKMLR